MSLNGLDDPKVKEAHEAAVAEPGGWFLLKYQTRDELELLGRGNGGIVEIRQNIAQYDEPSPLYGFLRYRRRNVIIKYLPDECSRLVQARTTVHFNTLCDFFAPCDTTFSISMAKELKDTKLSAACSLRTASGSTSSSTSSLRRRRLMEIAEEEEEERERKRQSLNEEERPDTALTEGSTGAPSALSPPVTLNSDLARSTNFTGRADPPDFVGYHRPTSPAKSLDEAARRMSSQSSRPDLYGYSSYPYSKPKVKLGPRPSLDSAGRPRTSAGTATYRPTASIPAGLKSLSKNSRSRSSHKSEDNAEMPIKEETEPPFPPASSMPIPEDAPLDPPPRPHTSSGASILHGVMSSAASIKSVTPSIPASNKHNTITPEMLRLAKAIKLREKRKRTANQVTAGNGPGAATSDEPTTSAPKHEEIGVIPEGVEVEEADPVNSEEHLHDHTSIAKADSGIEIEIGADHTSVDTRSDSHPTSPVGASSDIGGDSTQASSFSELTDETVQASSSDDKTLEPEPEADEETLAPEQSVNKEACEEVIHEPGSSGQAAELEERSVAMEHSNDGVETEEKQTEDEDREGGEDGEAGEDGEDGEDGEIIEDREDGTTETIASSRKSVIPISKFSARMGKNLGEPISFKESPPDPPATSDIAETKETGRDYAEPATPQPATPQPSQLKMPLSKFSTQELGKALPHPPKFRIPSIVAPDNAAEGNGGVEVGLSTLGRDEQEKLPATPEAQTSHPRRLPAVESIRTDLDPGEFDKRQSVVSLFDDDELMDELQSATFQEAKPMVVAKSPRASVFPQNATQGLKRAVTEGLDGGTSPSRIARTVSNPVRGPLLTPSDVSSSSARAVSTGAVHLNKVAQQSPGELRPKSAKIGNSISQRIKALERLSSSSAVSVTSSIAGDVTPKERPSSTFFAVRKTSVREPARALSVADQANSLTRGVTPSPDQSRESSPEEKIPKRDRSGSMASRLSVFEGGNLPRGRPDSIQVTARIVRDSSQPFPKAPEARTHPSDYEPLDLKQSPLVVDLQAASAHGVPTNTDTAVHGRAAEEEISPKMSRKPSLLQRRMSRGRKQSQSRDNSEVATEDGKDDTDTEGRQRRRSSLTIVKDFIKDRRPSLLGGTKSMSVDNLSLAVSPGQATPSRSPSRTPSVHQGLSFTRRLSISSRRSSIDQKSPVLPAATQPSSGGLSPSLMPEPGTESEGEGRSTGTNNGKNGGSRASRFIRRLSNSLGSNRKNITPSISPTVTEEEDAEVAAAGADASKAQAQGQAQAQAQSQPKIIAFMGDVNVQFPDNLLWKRRTMSLDNHGFLILSTVQGVAATNQAGAVKRYHMSDFRMPYTPDVEIQELPNSVVLDFVEGSGLQIACEDRTGQLNVLHILEDAHHKHSNFGL